MKPKSPILKALVGKQNNLPAELKAKIKASPARQDKPKLNQAQKDTVNSYLTTLPSNKYLSKENKKIMNSSVDRLGGYKATQKEAYRQFDATDGTAFDKNKTKNSATKMMKKSPTKKRKTVVTGDGNDARKDYNTNLATTTDRKGRVRKTVSTTKKTSQFNKDMVKLKESHYDTYGKESLKGEGAKKVRKDIRDRRNDAERHGENTKNVTTNKTTKKFRKDNSVKKSKSVNAAGTKTTIKTNKKGKSVKRVNKKGFQVSDVFGGKKVKDTPAKMKKESSMKMKKESSMKMKKKSPAKMEKIPTLPPKKMPVGGIKREETYYLINQGMKKNLMKKKSPSKMMKKK